MKYIKPLKKVMMIIFFTFTIFLFSSCINWAHVVEHNPMKTINGYVLE